MGSFHSLIDIIVNTHKLSSGFVKLLKPDHYRDNGTGSELQPNNILAIIKFNGIYVQRQAESFVEAHKLFIQALTEAVSVP